MGYTRTHLHPQPCAQTATPTRTPCQNLFLFTSCLHVLWGLWNLFLFLFFFFPPSNTDVGFSSIPQCLLFTLSVNMCQVGQPWHFPMFFFCVCVCKETKMLFHMIWFLYLLLPTSDIFWIINSKNRFHTHLHTPNWMYACIWASLLISLCILLSVRVCVGVCVVISRFHKFTGILNTHTFICIVRRSFSLTETTPFFRFLPGERLRNVYRGLQGWRWLHSRIVQSFQLPEQCS